MDYTKKIMYQSNSWYNDGLRKAQVRDMSGAIVSLQQSLQYNRENIAARNLLGLVYYGIGEVSEALVEWIISKNLSCLCILIHLYIDQSQKLIRLQKCRMRRDHLFQLDDRKIFPVLLTVNQTLVKLLNCLIQ